MSMSQNLDLVGLIFTDRYQKFKVRSNYLPVQNPWKWQLNLWSLHWSSNRQSFLVHLDDVNMNEYNMASIKCTLTFCLDTLPDTGNEYDVYRVSQGIQHNVCLDTTHLGSNLWHFDRANLEKKFRMGKNLENDLVTKCNNMKKRTRKLLGEFP